MQVSMVSSEHSSVVRLAQAYRRFLAAQQPPQISVVEALDGAEVTQILFYYFTDLDIRIGHPNIFDLFVQTSRYVVPFNS
jgi:hypothetical protein